MAFPPALLGLWYNNNGIIGDAGGFWGIAAVNLAGTTPGIRAGIWDGASKAVFMPAAVDVPHIIMMWRTPAGVLTLSIDGGPEQTIAAGAPSTTTGLIQLGCNFNASVFSQIYIRAIVASTQNGTAGDRTSLLEYLRSQYVVRSLSPPAGYTLAFSDEFNYVGPPDPTKWIVEDFGQAETRLRERRRVEADPARIGHIASQQAALEHPHQRLELHDLGKSRHVRPRQHVGRARLA